MKLAIFALSTLLIGSAAVQAETINRRNQCDKWEYVPASDALGNPETALLFCNDKDRTWLSLRIECHPAEKRMAITYQPGFSYAQPQEPSLQSPAIQEASNPPTTDNTEIVADFAEIPLEKTAIAETIKEDAGQTPKEMVFFDFRSFGYTSVAYFGDHDGWHFFEPEPLSPVFSKLISGSFADISLLATGTTERLPLRGSGKALRPLVESCRIAKRKG